MTPAERVVKCKAWRWMRGMYTNWGGLIVHVTDAGTDSQGVLIANQGGTTTYIGQMDEGEWPDLTDPATLGCIEDLVRERHGGNLVLMRGNGWYKVETDLGVWDDDNTDLYVEALVAALEAAP